MLLRKVRLPSASTDDARNNEDDGNSVSALDNVSEMELDLPQETPMDMAIMGDIYTGTPPQHLRVIVDSGSPDLWLPSTNCPWCQRRAVKGNKFFIANKTSSLKILRSKVDINALVWSTHPGMCLDVAAGGTDNGNRVQLWTCLNGSSGSADQEFMLPSEGVGPIRWAAHPEKCVDVSKGRVRNGNKIQIWDCINGGRSPNQLFKLSAGQIHWAQHPHKCLDVVGGGIANGTGIQLWDCNDGAAARNQDFALAKLRSTLDTVVRNIYFGTGRVEGIGATDTLRLAGLELPDQHFLIVEKEMFSPPDHVWDGILGLAKKHYSVIGAPFYTRLSEFGVQPVFAFIPTHSDQGTHVELRIGQSVWHSPEVYHPTLTWVPSDSEGLWYINASVGVHVRSARRFLVDTGTTVIVMPPSDFREFVAAIEPRRGCLFHKRRRRVVCACSDVPKMPPLKFAFGHVTLALAALDLFEPAEKGTFGGEPACELQVSLGKKGSHWVLGDNFLRKVVVIFDYEKMRVGFAAPVQQASLEMRVVNERGSLRVETRMTRHGTAVTRESASTLVQLSATTPTGTFVDAISLAPWTRLQLFAAMLLGVGAASGWAWTLIVRRRARQHVHRQSDGEVELLQPPATVSELHRSTHVA